MTTAAGRVRLLVWLLRFAGAITLTAFLAMVMPFAWMQATHEWLGLGVFPETPIVEYLARSIAALYGFHGALLMVISRDPVRHRAVIWFVAAMNTLFGAMLVAIDYDAGLPARWTLLEGPPIVAFGIVIAFLNRSTPSPR